ncbi:MULTISPECIES: hypothetical protein [Delftia]|uniref:Uncharacterized protein n=1 Tax=Delftia lacustris TaxID=558537 RepID=A0A1H3P104_9BURK|nr:MULTISPECIES: hypothetical protein [Delftia]EPD43268.1 hypothetical protein HMPREF9701_00970 [Delftia acidovorans CCUG 274B]PZP75039.1 MAG: hypothetical protein DI604_06585 [Delftia acidovorans]SDY94465.1 hypothetical protein SAMN05421547_109241 [Delftia lacustris]
MSINISMRHYLSIQHLLASALFSKQCQELEATAFLTPFDSIERTRHKSYAISSIMVSAAFLEATINELFADCADGHSTARLSPLPARGLMGRLWARSIPRTAAYPILEKYDIALELNDKEPFDPGINPYQDAKLLTELRNALIHYEPETIVAIGGDETRKPHKFEKRLRGKFALNSLTGAGNPFYPDKVLGAGCAEWAVKTAVDFTDAFFGRLGIPATYDHVRDRLI